MRITAIEPWSRCLGCRIALHLPRRQYFGAGPKRESIQRSTASRRDGFDRAAREDIGQ